VAYVDSETGDEVDLNDGWTISGATMSPPTGAGHDVTATITAEGAALFTFPAVFVDQGGEWYLEARFGLGGNIARAEPLLMLAEAADGWLTLSQLRRMWRDTPADDWVAWVVLDSAKAQCIQWAPKPAPADPDEPAPTDLGYGHGPYGGETPIPPASDPVPPNWLQAQYLACRAIWNETQSSTVDDTIGFDAVAVRIWQMSPGIKKLLRPPSAVPVVR
jgi:hypothetical protein